MKKVLLVARLGKFFSDFEISNIRILQEMGCDVWCAANFEDDNHKLDSLGVHKVHVDLVRSPLSRINIIGYGQLISLMREHDFQLVHCHMPIGGVFGRMAAHKTGTGPVIYTAHGFQFARGGPTRDWLLFYPVEKFLSRYTDILITINHEDYELASRKYHMKQALYLDGVGIDINKFVDGADIRDQLCRENGISAEGYLLLSVGELSKRKNHEVVIRGIAQLKRKYIKEKRIWDIHYFICGIGSLEQYLHELCKNLEVEDCVHFLGWREDIADICASADAFVFPSKREGLPVALMEAMAAGLPVIAAKARGNTELVKDNDNGLLCHENLPEEYAVAIERIQEMDPGAMALRSREILKPYQKELVQAKMIELYQNVLERKQQ